MLDVSIKALNVDVVYFRVRKDYSADFKIVRTTSIDNLVACHHKQFTHAGASEISGSHGGDYEDGCLLGCCAV
jgi:hypothetical protein